MRGACNALKSLTGDKPAAQIPWRQRSQPELANKAMCTAARRRVRALRVRHVRARAGAAALI